MSDDGRKGRKELTTQKKNNQKQLWIRVLCIFLAVLMIGSSLVAALSLF